jgi:TPR repeat protein
MYAFGYGVRENNKEAVGYYKLSADQGNSDAQEILDVLYANGIGSLMNDKEAGIDI